ncbi:MAG: DUF1015 domain-containing protein [Firmicutes bacterium]|nr:DUF1015 domain-containing protein [Bacillota bacterium]
MKVGFEALGIKIPEFLLPNPAVDLTKWAVVACDQYTSQPDYWEQVAGLIGSAPSTLNLIFPEVYLGKGDEEGRIRRIQKTMRDYLDAKVIEPQGPAFVFVRRETGRGKKRHGLIAALDLEHYDYHRGSQTLIRATEGTVLDRIPPRVRIREGAALELPHIMALIDDPEGRVIEPLAARVEASCASARDAAGFTRVYDTELMMNSGRVAGYRVDAPELYQGILEGLRGLADPSRFNQKYGVTGQPVLLFAVGDGNHSLATAKAVWEKLKQGLAGSPDLMDHPARYALVELVNLHDPGLEFEPIHRVVFGVALPQLWEAMKTYYHNQGAVMTLEFTGDSNTAREKAREYSRLKQGAHLIRFITENGWGLLIVEKSPQILEAGSLQLFLDDYLSNNPQTRIDYIHGDEVVTELGQKPGNIGFYLPPMAKNGLFKTVIINGVLPRKTFSMGEADEKRFYMECRKIVKEY